jgi:hypothetical protein
MPALGRGRDLSSDSSNLIPDSVGPLAAIRVVAIYLTLSFQIRTCMYNTQVLVTYLYLRGAKASSYRTLPSACLLVGETTSICNLGKGIELHTVAISALCRRYIR